MGEDTVNVSFLHDCVSRLVCVQVAQRVGNKWVVERHYDDLESFYKLVPHSCVSTMSMVVDDEFGVVMVHNYSNV